MQHNGWDHGLKVTDDGAGLAGHCGGVLLRKHLRGPGRVLRGRTPELARQELWAYLAVYQAIRAIIVRAAAGAGLDPDPSSSPPR